MLNRTFGGTRLVSSSFLLQLLLLSFCWKRSLQFLPHHHGNWKCRYGRHLTNDADTINCNYNRNCMLSMISLHSLGTETSTDEALTASTRLTPASSSIGTNSLTNSTGTRINLNTPKHIAFVCDGNTRWAKQQQKPTVMGHFMGANRTMELIQTIRQRYRPSLSSPPSLSLQNPQQNDENHFDYSTITHLTFFALSTENWNRPPHEIQNLFQILERTAHYWYHTLQEQDANEQIKEGDERSIIIKFIGDLDDPRIPNSLRTILYKLQERATPTETCEPLTICIAINYGGRQDIVRASQRLMINLLQEKKSDGTSAAINEDDIRQYMTAENLQHCLLDTHNLPDPDLLIRTSGEIRLSNFLLWQVAYTELYFTNIYWPDFTMTELQNAIAWYSQRQRRFGSSTSNE